MEKTVENLTLLTFSFVLNDWFSMIGLIFVVALISIHISLISTFPIRNSHLTLTKKRADSCGLFDADPICSPNSEDFFSVGGVETVSDLLPGEWETKGDLLPVEWETGSDLLPGEANTETGLLPEEIGIYDDIGSNGSSGQTSFIEDSSMPSLGTDGFAAGVLNSDPSQSQVDEGGFKTEPNSLSDVILDDPIMDQPETTFEVASHVDHSVDLSIRYSCEEFGDTCVQYKNGVRTGLIVYVRCNQYNQFCELCDQSGSKCGPNTWPVKQNIPSPENPWGQAWNHCRNQQCGGPCEMFAIYLGFLSLGVIPGCGPPDFQ